VNLADPQQDLLDFLVLALLPLLTLLLNWIPDPLVQGLLLPLPLLTQLLVGVEGEEFWRVYVDVGLGYLPTCVCKMVVGLKAYWKTFG
jgi:hypothetical protein